MVSTSALPFTFCLLLLSESRVVLDRVDKAVDHRAVVVRPVQRVNPLQVENIWIASEVTEILHDDEHLVVEFLIDLRAFGDRAQNLSPGLSSGCEISD